MIGTWGGDHRAHTTATRRPVSASSRRQSNSENERRSLRHRPEQADGPMPDGLARDDRRTDRPGSNCSKTIEGFSSSVNDEAAAEVDTRRKAR